MSSGNGSNERAKSNLRQRNLRAFPPGVASARLVLFEWAQVGETRKPSFDSRNLSPSYSEKWVVPTVALA